jgi:eukaryotic-like serine/threonine-protein kinase
MDGHGVSTIGGVSTFVGTHLGGRYRLDERIGTGGMSTVYRAFDTVLERPVAVKVMHRDIAHDADQLERFRREARAVAQLNHPHIVQVIDAGEELDGGHAMPYIVFEYVEGQTLKERIRHFGRLDIPEAIAYAIEIARALGAAHDRGIVHRDVKPQNVLVDDEGSAKVTDFGIARSLDQDGLTADGRVLGTTDYVSPEQALGHPVGGQSDLYSLGVVLYEMLTGEVPFRGENQVAVAMKHVREELPDIQYRRPEVSSALAAILDRVTAKDLAVRYASDRELIADLEDVLTIEAARSGQATGEATQVLRTLPAPARRRVPLRLRASMTLVVALLVLGGAALGGVLFFAADQTERGTGAARDAPPPEPSLVQVSLGARAAEDYDPLGDGVEHADETAFVTDRDPNSTWSTESYRGGLNKPGVGIALDAEPGVDARVLEVRSPTPGFTATVYGATGDSMPETIPDPAWTELAPSREFSGREEVELRTDGRRFRWYLLWITELPPDSERASISEMSLFREQR